jgi:hypothetical protein
MSLKEHEYFLSAPGAAVQKMIIASAVEAG